MAVLLAVVALGLMAYLPGRFLLRLLAPAGVEAPHSRLLAELLIGNAAVGLAAFALAELGIFSLAAVLAVLAVVSGAAAYRGRAASPAGYTRVDASGALIALAVLAWVTPPFDTTLYGYDSSVYLASGRSLQRHGSLAFVDPTIAEMPRSLRAEVFPSYRKERGTPPFVRVAGGLLVQNLDAPVVLPAFHHLLAVWVGLASAIAGDDAVTAPAPYFAALAVCAVACFVWTMSGATAALLCLALLLVSAPEHWYSRFLMPEVPSQFFLWAGLAAASASFAPSGALLGVAAGLGLGVAGLMRLDGLGHTIVALAVWKAVAPSRSWPAARGFVPAFVLVTLYAALHQVLFPTHYLAEMEGLVRGAAARLAFEWRNMIAGAVILTGGLAMQSPHLSRLGRVVLRIAAAVFAIAYAAATLATTRPDPGPPFGWLVLYAGWPILAAAAAGWMVWALRANRPSERFALLLGFVVLVQLVCDPRVTPAPLWAVRRFVPLVLPVILISAALLLERLGRSRRWLLVAGTAVFLAGIYSRNAITYGHDAFTRSADHVQALAALLPPDAVVVFDPQFAVDTQFHIALWGEADIPAYLLASDMRAPLSTLRATFRQRPLYWAGAGTEASSAGIGDIADPVASYRFNVVTRRVDWYDAREDLGMHDTTLWLYRLRPPSEPPALQ